jgi:hypothetical protein
VGSCVPRTNGGWAPVRSLPVVSTTRTNRNRVRLAHWSASRKHADARVLTVPKTTLGDLVDTPGAAQLLGLTRREFASYRRRYPDFPQPIDSNDPRGRTQWRRDDLEAWQRARRPDL